MELFFAPLENEDYEILCEYWKFWKFPAPPKKCLPNGGTGGIKLVNEEKEIVCAGFLYETNSGIAWLEFIVSNPNIRDKNIRHDALVQLISFLTIEAEEKGFDVVFTSIINENLIKKYEEVGYTKNTMKSTELSIVLK